MSMAIKYAMQKKAKKMAEGGMAHAKDDYDPMEHPKPVHDEAAEMEDDDMIGRIMRKRFSKGGRVANDTPVVADFEDNDFDDLVLRDGLDSDYTGDNSGDELGNGHEDMDRRDIVSRIMRSRAKKDRLPRPA